MSKVLVVTYSYTGTCRRLAQSMCSQQGWRMAEISDARPRSGRLGTIRCALDSWLRREPSIHYVGPSVEDFDLVVLMAPIWLLQLAGPMRSFVVSRRLKMPAFAVVPVMGGNGAPNAIAEIGRILGRAPLLSTSFTAREVEDGSGAARLDAFGKALLASIGEHRASRPSIWSPQTA
jgi:flavodoxin